MAGETGELGRHAAGVALDDRADVNIVIDDRDQGSRGRRDAVERAVGSWRRHLIETSANNRLLKYRDLKVGTLDLTPAGPSGVAPLAFDRLLAGSAVTLSRLFPDPEMLTEARRRVSNIRTKAQMVLEEKGLETLYVVIGLARWQPPGPRSDPHAPVVLCPVGITAEGAGQTEYRIALTGDPHINPILSLVLRAEHEVSGLERVLAETMEGQVLGAESGLRLLEALRRVCREVPGFEIAPRAILGNFSHSTLSMVMDMATNVEMLVEHDVVAAMAGVPEAVSRLRTGASRGEPAGLDVLDPADEYLVLDADAAQHAAIARVLAGESLVIQGPPGTGKSQTIANLIASLAATGRSVLFVAEKRAAIQAVTERLDRVGLGGMIMDALGGTGTRRKILSTLHDTLRSLQAPDAQDDVPVGTALAERRDQLRNHVDALHESRHPWGWSVHQLRERLAVLGFDEAGPLDRNLHRLSLPQLEEILVQVDELLARPASDGGGAWDVVAIDRTDPRRLIDAMEAIEADLYPAAMAALTEAVDEIRLSSPTTLDGWRSLIKLLQEVGRFQERFDPVIYKENLEATVFDLAPAEKGAAYRLRAMIFSNRYREAIGAVRDAALGPRPSAEDALKAATVAIHQKGEWVLRRKDGRLPRVPSDLDRMVERFEALATGVDRLVDLVPDAAWWKMPSDAFIARIREMIDQRHIAVDAAARLQIERRLRSRGVWHVVKQATAAESDPARIRAFVEQAWIRSVLAEVARHDPVVASFDGPTHEGALDEFRRLDLEHQAKAPARVRQRVAGRAREVLQTNPKEAEIVVAQAERPRSRLPIRSIFERAPHLLPALRPCWVMSPLLAAEMIPPAVVFDAVVFDEASQITPAEAVASIARARQVVVAGDGRQLPPTIFFAKTVADEVEGDADEEMVSARDSESILDLFAGGLLGVADLTWHYRSMDERLIAFSNRELYGGRLSTFPAVTPEPAISHVVVPFRPLDTQGTRSNPDEVDRVVDLVLEHAERRRHLSLGVITMGQSHERNIESELRRRLADRPSPSLDAFFAGDRMEPFFVKSLERSQGDERDAVIVSVGYHKAPDGRLPARFGPLLHDGGERRLNVAVTRARRSLVLVTSFEAADMDPARFTAPGVALLRQYLEFAAAPVVSERPDIQRPSSALVAQICTRLENAGVPTRAAYGMSGYTIDVAAAHPDDPERMVLAIELDGDNYRSAGTVRERDRLRPQMLESLGWAVHRIWSADWLADPRRETHRAVNAWVDAVMKADEKGRSVGAAGSS